MAGLDVGMESNESNKSNETVQVEPVFFLNNDVPQEEGNYFNTLEVCYAVCKVVSSDKHVEGAQRIGGLWRIYLTDLDARVQLLATGINLRGCKITLKEKNPFIHKIGYRMGYRPIETTRVYVRNIPLSYDNAEIEKALKSLDVVTVSELKYARARTKLGKLTNFKTGDRFIDIVKPSEPLPKKLEMGIFMGSIYHKEQKQPAADMECGICKERGHLRRDCPNEPVCFACGQIGHKKGSDSCKETIEAFGLDDGKEGDMTIDDKTDDDETDNEAEMEEAAEGKEGKEGKTNSDRTKLVVAKKLKEIKERQDKEESDDAKEMHQKHVHQSLLTKFMATKVDISPNPTPRNSPRNSPGSSPSVKRTQDKSPQEETEKKKEKKKSKHA